MPVKVRCSGCEKVLNAPDKFRGKTVKCPKCKSPLKIPAAEPKKAKKEADPFGDDFLADLDLSQAEDQSQRICPRCGAAVGEDDIDCERCGASLMAGGAVAGPGGRSPVGRKKKKGPNKSLFFKKTWSDAWAFLQKNKGYAIKTSLIVFIVNALFLGCVFMFNWCINTPPKAFWALLTFVFFMAPIGWIWHFVTETITASLAKQSKLKRVNFDFFTSIAFGIKFFAWMSVGGAPFLVLLGVPGGFLMRSGNVIPGAILTGTGCLLAISLLPVAMTHMAMPQQMPGWMPNKVFPGWGKSIGAIAYWVLILLLTSLPVTGSIAAIGATSTDKIETFSRTMSRNAELLLEQQEAEVNEEAAAPQGETEDLPWDDLTIPLVLLAVALLSSGPVVVFNARIIGQIAYYYGPDMDLNALEKQLKYKTKPKPGETGGPKKVNRTGLPTVATGMNITLAAFAIAVLIQLAYRAVLRLLQYGVIEISLERLDMLLKLPEYYRWAMAGAGGLFLVGVVFLFATPSEAKARLFPALSLISQAVGVGLVVMVNAGVLDVNPLKLLDLDPAAVAIYAGMGICWLAMFIFYASYLKALSEYVYYFAGSDIADEMIILTLALGGVMGIGFGSIYFVPLDFLQYMGPAIDLIVLGLQIRILIKLVELVRGLKEECHKTA